MVLDKDTILKIMPKAPAENADALAFVVSKYGAKMGLKTPNALAIFLGNVAHESDQLRRLKEGDNKAGTYLKSKSYFPYIGFGPIQVTHDDAYLLVSKTLYNDDRFLKNPSSIFLDKNALMLGSLIWWKTNYESNYQSLRTNADAGNAVAVSNVINTGKKNVTAKKLEERLQYINNAIIAMKKKIYRVRFKDAVKYVNMPLWYYLLHLSKNKK